MQFSKNDKVNVFCNMQSVLFKFGDLSTSIQNIILKRETPESKLAITDVDFFLQKLSESNLDSSSKSALKMELRDFFSKLSSLEHKWLVRIILKDLKLGISEQEILQQFSLNSVEILNKSFDLKKVIVINIL